MITFLSNLSQLATSTVFWISFVVLATSYLLLATRCTTLKQRAWVLTALSSAFMSLCSLPLVFQFVAARGQLKYISIPPVATESVGRFFQAYLIADLTMGLLFYRSKVNLLTGWIHHAVYIFIVEYSIQYHGSGIFSLCAIMEVPTFLLALGSITPRLRSDIFFTLCFFVTRIVFHLVVCVSLVEQHRDVGDGSFGAAIIMACIFPLHAHWFSGCIKGFFKRAKTADKTVSVTATRLPATVIPLPDRPITSSSMSVPISLYASRASLARRRTALRLAVRARWDQLGLWNASGRLGEMQRRVRAALPARERVYQYVGLERRWQGMSDLPAEYEQQVVEEDASGALSVS